jgi:DNA mismatch repair protein MutS
VAAKRQKSGARAGETRTTASDTPVMQQHAAAKLAHPDCIVFFRLGDFYEMFGQDAVIAARELGLTLTSRNRGKPDEIPMAGVPHHAAHGYIARLLERGMRVAICEQMADPRMVKGIVPREVVRVITPGTWTEPEHLEDGKNAWLAVVQLADEGLGVALFDLGTAELVAARVQDLGQLLAELARAAPREVHVVGGAPAARASAAAALTEILRAVPVSEGDALAEDERLAALRGVDFVAADPLAADAAAWALAFARRCLKGRAPEVFRVAAFNPSGLLELDRTAVRHLELAESTSDEPTACLLAVLDRTRTPLGARLLRRRLLGPLTDVEAIRRRLDAVEVLVVSGQTRRALVAELAEVGDLERVAVRAARGDASPRDLGLLRRGLLAGASALARLAELPDVESRRALAVEGEVDLVQDLCALLERALVERPPAQTKEGAVFRAEYDRELGELAALRTSGTERVVAFEESLRAATGISSLRVRSTRVFGWYVEVSRSQLAKVPEGWRRKQTVAGAERFTLDQLDELSYELATADERFRVRELELLTALRSEAARAAARVHRLAALLAHLDVTASLAEVATEHDYCRPEVNDSDELELSDARHPVVERLAAAGRFVPNDVTLASGREHLWVLSGPNMAGKSTFLRQVALAVVMAQMGSYVPARAARIGVVDRVLSRVGASDNLAGGESTFMVEMRETATILRRATSRSLVILDEVGRGTSTYDGLSIAWSVAEYLDRVVRCRALFATHYHELTEYADGSESARNVCVSARQHGDEVVFLHRVVPGAASRSFGVEVARLAGLPEVVLARARALLGTFEGQRVGPGPSGPASGAPQLDLFAAPRAAPTETEVLETLRALDPDRLSGLDALQLLHQLKLRLGAG